MFIRNAIAMIMAVVMVLVPFAGTVEAADWFEEETWVPGGAPYPDTLYFDSHGAYAWGWEIEEAMRKIMLEAGGESEEDIRAHVEVDLKQLLYCQTVGGYDDWGTSLWGVTHSHGYLETNTRLWTPEAEPTELVRYIFWDVWKNGYFSDFRVQNYRSGWYHSLTWSIPAYQIGNSFYSINIWQDFSMFNLDENGVLGYE